MRLELVPLSLEQANAFVAKYHRHHQPVVGAKFCVGVTRGEWVNDGSVHDAGEVVGVAIVGRPVARMLSDGWTLEVTRTCVLDGAHNVNSMLYGACWRAAQALGYKRLITYTLPEESGVSLTAAGWGCVNKKAGGGSWSRKNRPRIDTHPLQQKLRWEMRA